MRARRLGFPLTCPFAFAGIAGDLAENDRCDHHDCRGSVQACGALLANDQRAFLGGAAGPQEIRYQAVYGYRLRPRNDYPCGTVLFGSGAAC